MDAVLLVLSTAAASAVEMVEALTVVLAVGVTRGWRSARWGAAVALVALGLVVIVLGPALAVIPIDALRLVVGTVLLIFGLQWLRKAILRSSGLKALHDEDEIFRDEVDELNSAEPRMWRGHDWYSFTITFKAVFLEGLEVVFIVLTFGTTQGRVPLAAAGALLAVLVVGSAGVVVHRPLSQVPENTLKFGVGVMLTSFGMFWAAEGAGIEWPGSELAIVALVAIVGGVAVVIVAGCGARPIDGWRSREAAQDVRRVLVRLHHRRRLDRCRRRGPRGRDDGVARPPRPERLVVPAGGGRGWTGDVCAPRRARATPFDRLAR